VRDDVHPADYVRRVVRQPPPPNDAAAHLTWLRVMAKMLMELNAWAPLFTIAACSEARCDTLLREFCEDGAFEKSFFDRVPAALCFLEHYLKSSRPVWIKDLGRCEFWSKAALEGVPSIIHPELSGLHGDPPIRIDQTTLLRKLIALKESSKGDCLVVSHDVLDTMQTMWGFADTSVVRVSGLLWQLGVAPVFVKHEPREQPGVVLFQSQAGSLNVSFLQLQEGR
jgi:hypothetical protein